PGDGDDVRHQRADRRQLPDDARAVAAGGPRDARRPPHAGGHAVEGHVSAPKDSLDPPRHCPQCGARLAVLITPTRWAARCKEHGEVLASPVSNAAVVYDFTLELRARIAANLASFQRVPVQRDDLCPCAVAAVIVDAGHGPASVL